MLKVTDNNECGVIALFDIAYHAAGSRTLTKKIAVRQGFSEAHIRQVFQKLKRARLVKSVRGYGGGYSLGKPVEEISIGDVIRALDGPIQFVGCVGEGAKSRAYCERIHRCVTRDIWKASSAVLTEFLDSVTLADLCGRAEAMGIRKSTEQGLMYHI